MKKSTIVAAIAILASSALFTSCKKEDVTAPVVTLNGGDETVILNGSYSDLGATAKDNKDGSISVSVTGVVDVNRTGVYELTYTATDKAGNEGKATRNVTVYNELDVMNGTYSCTITTGPGSPYTYTQTVTASTTVNRRINFGKFGDYVNNTGIYMNVTNTGLTSPTDLPSQTAIQVGNPAADRTFAGTGARSSATTFSLSYTETTSLGSSNFTEVYTKQ